MVLLYKVGKFDRYLPLPPKAFIKFKIFWFCRPLQRYNFAILQDTAHRRGYFTIFEVSFSAVYLQIFATWPISKGEKKSLKPSARKINQLTQITRLQRANDSSVRTVSCTRPFVIKHNLGKRNGPSKTANMSVTTQKKASALVLIESGPSNSDNNCLVLECLQFFI